MATATVILMTKLGALHHFEWVAFFTNNSLIAISIFENFIKVSQSVLGYFRLSRAENQKYPGKKKAKGGTN